MKEDQNEKLYCFFFKRNKIIFNLDIRHTHTHYEGKNMHFLMQLILSCFLFGRFKSFSFSVFLSKDIVIEIRNEISTLSDGYRFNEIIAFKQENHFIMITLGEDVNDYLDFDKNI